MRLLAALVVGAALAACTQPAPPPSQPASSAPPAAPPEPTAASSSPIADPPAPGPTAPPATSAPPAPPGALFVYEEGGDRLAFLPPRTTRTTLKSGTVCDNDLPDHGNIWTPRDVENVFSHAEVKEALKAHQTYVAATAGSLRAPGHVGSIIWADTCRGCLAAPDGVKRLHDVLKGLMMNRRLLCK
jgi:hypothetical protein